MGVEKLYKERVVCVCVEEGLVIRNRFYHHK